MKRLSLQWRITLMTALLIAGACICLNLLLYRSGASGMDNLNGYVLQYQQDGGEDLTIEIPEDQMSDFLVQFSQEVYDTKTIFGRKGWYITAVVTLFSAAIAYFISGKALEPLKELAQQAEKVDQDNLVDVRLEENTVAEFRQLSQSVNQMLNRLAHSFDLQRQFAGNAAHELKTPLAIMQAKLEIFAEDHMNTDAETAELVHFQTEQIARLSALVRTLLEMSNLQAVPRDDCIELAPLADEIVTDLTPLAQKKQITLHQECEDIHIIGSDALIYRMLFNLVENAIKYNQPGGSVQITISRSNGKAILRVADTGCGIPDEYRTSIFEPFFRVDKSRSREMGGAGLGLALVREIAALHGGTVQDEPAEGAGTVFTVALGRENEMTGAGGIGKQKPPVKEKCTSSLNVTLANYKEEGGLPFAVCCSRPYIVYQTVKKLHFCLIACVGRPLVARQLTAATHFPGQFSYDAPPDRKQRLCLGEAVSALRCHCGARIPRPGPPFPRCAHPCGKTEKRRIYLHRIPHVRQKLAFSALHCKETGRGRQCDPCAVHGAL